MAYVFANSYEQNVKTFSAFSFAGTINHFLLSSILLSRTVQYCVDMALLSCHDSHFASDFVRRQPLESVL